MIHVFEVGVILLSAFFGLAEVCARRATARRLLAGVAVVAAVLIIQGSGIVGPGQARILAYLCMVSLVALNQRGICDGSLGRAGKLSLIAAGLCVILMLVAAIWTEYGS